MILNKQSYFNLANIVLETAIRNKKIEKLNKKDNTGLTPSPIHFKHVKDSDTEEPGIITMPIHFKYVKHGLHLDESFLVEKTKVSETPIKHISTWLKTKDNIKHGTNGELSKKLHSTNKFTEIHKKK